MKRDKCHEEIKYSNQIVLHSCPNLNSLASAVSPAIDMPIWSSIGIIFFWCAESSEAAR